jgi:hypothetical protein
MRLAMTFPAQHDTIKQRRIGADDEIRVGAERRTEADINSGTTPALGSYEGDLLEALDTRRKQSQGDEYGERRLHR